MTDGGSVSLAEASNAAIYATMVTLTIASAGPHRRRAPPVARQPRAALPSSTGWIPRSQPNPADGWRTSPCRSRGWLPGCSPSV